MQMVKRIRVDAARGKLLDHYDVAVVGAGIMGLAQAWVAARDGKSVVVFERDRQAVGASIRNFGMVWPIGQTLGAMHAMAMASRRHWCRLAHQAGFWLSECGSLHLAHRDDAWSVLQEFAAVAPSIGFDCQLLTPGEVVSKAPAANPHGLLGGYGVRRNWRWTRGRPSGYCLNFCASRWACSSTSARR